MKLFKSVILTATLIFSLLLSLNASARSTVPIINYDNLSVATSSGPPLQAEQVKQAILLAASAKGWNIAQQADGKLLATLNVRGKHSIALEVAYAADQYSLHYQNSTNMNFGERDAQAMIHPNYNKWVQDFREAIRLELLKR